MSARRDWERLAAEGQGHTGISPVTWFATRRQKTHCNFHLHLPALSSAKEAQFPSITQWINSPLLSLLQYLCRGKSRQRAPLHFLWLQLPSTPFSHESCTCRALLSGMARVWRLRQLPLCHVLLQSPQILTDEIQSICNPLKPIRSNSLWTRPPHWAGVALPPRFVPEHVGEQRRARALTHTSTFSFSLLLAFPQCEKRVW